MRIRLLSLLMSIVFIVLMLCSCGSSDAKSVYKPPAEVFDVKISGTSEPEIDGVRFTYDSKARIDTVTFTYDGYDYTQQYSYDNPAQIVIKTIYQTEIIEEKVIRYVDIPVESGYTTIDGYIIRVTEDMPVSDSASSNGNNDSNPNNAKETTTPKTEIDYSNLIKTIIEDEHYRIPEILIDSPDIKTINSELISYCEYADACNYTHYTNKGFLSVIITIFTPGGSFSKAWTIDIESGETQNNADLLTCFAEKDESIVKRIREAEDNHFGEMFDYQWSQRIIDTYNSAYESTMDSENLNNYHLAVGKNGLLAIISEYTMAGQGISSVIIDLNVPRTYTSVNGLINEY